MDIIDEHSQRGMAAPPSPGRTAVPPAVRDAAFVVLAVSVAAGAYLATRESPALASLLVLTLSIATGMHARLAIGRWHAVAQILGAAWVLFMIGAPPLLAWALLLGGLVGTELVASSTRRAGMLRAGAVTGGVACLVHLSGAVAVGSLAQMPTLIEAASALAGGVLAGSLVLVIGPPTEWLFGHTTRLTMSEWLNYDQPLLRELSLHAPGTFQHSVNVGILADAAAAAIGADALQARVGGLYHDVGKLRAPEYFVENQPGVNPHDALEPWTSAAILRAHVTDGVELIRAHGMGERIADFVREHHGTGRMRLLEQKASALGVEVDADGETYRYPGPSPRSRETGLVMIADQLEATARSAPPGDAQACDDLVARTLERIVRDGELQASRLGDKDLRAVRPAFARVLAAMHHRRMAYPPARDAEPPRSRLAAVPRFFSRAGRARADST